MIIRVKGVGVRWGRLGWCANELKRGGSVRLLAKSSRDWHVKRSEGFPALMDDRYPYPQANPALTRPTASTLSHHNQNLRTFYKNTFVYFTSEKLYSYIISKLTNNFKTTKGVTKTDFICGVYYDY